jgi:hypothetical protein
MRVEKRKEKSIFHKAITDVLTDCKNDKDYFQRLLWAQEIITRCLNDFLDEEDDELE